MPVVIIAGEEDKLIDIDSQSARLHSDVSHSVFHRLAGNGHMIRQTATDQVMSAIREVEWRAHQRNSRPANSTQRAYCLHETRLSGGVFVLTGNR